MLLRSLVFKMIRHQMSSSVRNPAVPSSSSSPGTLFIYFFTITCFIADLLLLCLLVVGLWLENVAPLPPFVRRYGRDNGAKILQKSLANDS